MFQFFRTAFGTRTHKSKWNSWRGREGRLKLERLEDRNLLAVFTVTVTADNGAGSLRQAILDANAAGGPDVIQFNIGAGGLQTIEVNSKLPDITGAAVINGTTQPGFAGSPLIEINGPGLGGPPAGLFAGLTILGGATTVQGLIVNNFGTSGIVIGSAGNTIIGNYIGTDPTGTQARANGFYGIHIVNTPNNIIGGTTAAARNLISGNGISGLFLEGGSSTGNTIQGNYIGTTLNGAAALGNGFDGIELFSGSNNLIGGTVPGATNLISGNMGNGVSITGPSANLNTVQGNLVGVNLAGTAALGNALDGVGILEGFNNLVGGTTVAARNIISANGTAGVSISGSTATGNLVQGNFVGTSLDGAAPLGNAFGGVVIDGAANSIIGGTVAGTANRIGFNGLVGVLVSAGVGNAILGNSIFANVGLGIDLGFVDPDDLPSTNGVTPNDPQDPDIGPNLLQNFPSLVSAVSFNGTTTIRGSFNSTPNTLFRVELFTNLVEDPSLQGEGETFLLAQNVLTDANGNATLTINAGIEIPRGRFITATATNPSNSTSEFSVSVGVVGPRFLITAADSGGGPHVVTYDQETQTRHLSFFAYHPTFAGGVRVASGDFNGDGIADIVTAPGPGGGPHVRVFDGTTGENLPGPIGNFFAYHPTFAGGVFVAVGDVNGDMVPDIITGAGENGGPHVRVFHGVTGLEIAGFFAYDVAFSGGVRVAAANLVGDGRVEIITGAGPGGGPHVRVFDGTTLALTAAEFLAYDPLFAGGVYVSAGDVDGNGQVDIVTGAGAGGGPHVRSFNGATGAPLASPIGSFFAFDPAFAGGVRVATSDSSGDGVADVIAGAGPGGEPNVRTFRGPDGQQLQTFLAYHPAFRGGVFVSGSALPPAIGSPLLVAAEDGGPPPSPTGSVLDTSQLDLLNLRLGSALTGVDIRVADLPPGMLASASGTTILLDRDAAGYGWFVDPTPALNEEFPILSAAGLRAAEGSAAQGAIDLLTVLAHEVGHLNGHPDLFTSDELDELMLDRLSPGVRRSRSLEALDAFFAAGQS